VVFPGNWEISSLKMGRLCHIPFLVASFDQKAVSALDKQFQKGTLHGNTASRYKSRLGKRVTGMK
jgi:hypothetical protein